MDEYKKTYIVLWKNMTDDIKAIENHNFGIAREILIAAQREGERLFINENINLESLPQEKLCDNIT